MIGNEIKTRTLVKNWGRDNRWEMLTGLDLCSSSPFFLIKPIFSVEIITSKVIQVDKKYYQSQRVLVWQILKGKRLRRNKVIYKTIITITNIYKDEIPKRNKGGKIFYEV